MLKFESGMVIGIMTSKIPFDATTNYCDILGC